MTTRNEYLALLNHQFWDYASSERITSKSLLDRNQRTDKRPPVFCKFSESTNILVPPACDEDACTAIEATLPLKERHRHFAGMKSSQALAQSVFGNLMVSGHLENLSGLMTGQGLPAFFTDVDSATAQLEYGVTHLGEPRPTSVDLWIAGPYRIAIEYKLTEPDFGTCSRPRLRANKDKNYFRDYCDGNYRKQMGRVERCSLTEIGVEYWEYVPQLFNWHSEIDLVPCPLCDTYQLVRNILAACVLPIGVIDAQNAHVLVVYDERNPSFQDGGNANKQWKTTRAALKDPSLPRSCSWQLIVNHLSQDQNFFILIGCQWGCFKHIF